MKRLTILLVFVWALPVHVLADTVALWRFSKAPGGKTAKGPMTVRDDSGFGNHGQVIGQATYGRGSGIDGTALELSGNGLVEVPDAHVFDLAGDFTIEAMVRTGKRTGQYIFFRNGPGGEIWIRQHAKAGHDAAIAALIKTDKGLDLIISGPRAVVGEDFHHVSLVRRVTGARDGGQLVLYIDGKPVASKQKPINRGPLAFSSLTSIGGFLGGGSRARPQVTRPWIGAIDFVRVSNTALNSSQFLMPGGTSPEKILAQNRAPAVLAKIRAIQPKLQPKLALPRPQFNMKPTGQLGAFPRDFQPHVQLFVPEDQLGAIDPSPYKNLFPDVLIHDFDGDGHKDIWTEKRFYRNTREYRNGVPVFDRFQEKAAPALGRVIADLDNNGVPEIISARDKPPMTMSRHELIPPSADNTTWSARTLETLKVVALSDPSDTPLQSLTRTWPYETIDVVDWDGDGRLDLLCSGHPKPAGFDVGWQPFLGWGFKRSFWPRNDPQGMLLAGQIYGTIWWHRNLGTREKPVFHPGRIVTAGRDDRLLMHWGGVSCTATDFDQDGDPDLLVHNSMGLFLYRNQGRPVDQRVYDNRRARLGEPERILFAGADEALADPGMLRVVDWSKDHRKCLVFREQGYGLLYFAPNHGTLKKPRYQDITPWVTRGGPLTTGIFTIPKVADWNGDGHPDLILGSQAGYVHYCRNLGRKGDRPQFATPVMLRANGRLVQPRTMSGMTDVTFGVHFCYTNPEVADWDGDGDLDLLLGWQGATLSFHENIGSRTAPRLAPAVEITRDGKAIFSGARSRPAAVDFNRDGMIDLVAPDIEGYLVVHRRGKKGDTLVMREPERLKLENGKDIFVSGYTGDQDDGSYGQRLNARIKLSVFDWDRDGDLDLAVGNRGHGLRLFENVGTAGKPVFRFTGSPGFLTNHPGGHYRMAEPCDFDGDGRFEVITGADFGPVFYFPRSDRPAPPGK